MIRKVFKLVLVMLIFNASRAEAYIDPGTGSMILQAFVAVLALGGVFWRNILSFFKKKKDEEPDQDDF